MIFITLFGTVQRMHSRWATFVNWSSSEHNIAALENWLLVFGEMCILRTYHVETNCRHVLEEIYFCFMHMVCTWKSASWHLHSINTRTPYARQHTAFLDCRASPTSKRIWKKSPLCARMYVTRILSTQVSIQPQVLSLPRVVDVALADLADSFESAD
jgi:hypothetical protein